MRILVLNGPNINLLGIREPEVYGYNTYKDLKNLIFDYATEKRYQIDIVQSNHEGDLIDALQASVNNYDGIVFNPAAYTHTSIAIYDTLLAIDVPCVEVHISDIDNREDFRKRNFIRNACVASVVNKGIYGYLEAIRFLESVNK